MIKTEMYRIVGPYLGRELNMTSTLYLICHSFKHNNEPSLIQVIYGTHVSQNIAMHRYGNKLFISLYLCMLNENYMNMGLL